MLGRCVALALPMLLLCGDTPLGCQPEPHPEPQPAPQPSPQPTPQPPPLATPTPLPQVNLDTSTAIAFVAYGSPILAQLEVYVQGKRMIMTNTAYNEFVNIVFTVGGPIEQAQASAFMARVEPPIPDSPSARALALRSTNHLEPEDITILGTGDRLGIVTMTADAKAVRAATAQGVNFAVFLHQPVSLKGR